VTEEAIPTNVPYWYYLVLAEVMFSDENGVHMARSQFYHRGEEQRLGAGRINHLTQVAAVNVRNTLPKDISFELHEVHFVSINCIGQFTEDEFWDGVERLVNTGERVEDATPVADGETSSADNVVPFRNTED
jgi:hypothetical protein